MASVRSSSIGTSAGSSDCGTTAPTGSAAGDVSIVICHSNGTAITQTDNNGATPWAQTLLYTGSTEETIGVWVRRLTGSEASPYSFTLGSSQRNSAVAVTVQNPAAASVYDVTPIVGNSAQNDSGAATTLSASDITTIGANALHLIVCGLDGLVTVTGTPLGYDVLQNSGDECICVAAKTIGSPSATGAQAFTFTANAVVTLSFALATDPDPSLRTVLTTLGQGRPPRAFRPGMAR